jgi:hypothetical protein
VIDDSRSNPRELAVVVVLPRMGMQLYIQIINNLDVRPALGFSENRLKCVETGGSAHKRL